MLSVESRQIVQKHRGNGSGTMCSKGRAHVPMAAELLWVRKAAKGWQDMLELSCSAHITSMPCHLLLSEPEPFSASFGPNNQIRAKKLFPCLELQNGLELCTEWSGE